MIGIVKALGLSGLTGRAALAIGAAGLLAFGAGFFVGQVRAVYEDGRTHERALWKAELALKEVEAQGRIDAAREAGRIEGSAEVARAETRASAAENALRRQRDAEPDFDAAMRATWPDDYFDSVCDGRPADCLPEN